MSTRLEEINTADPRYAYVERLMAEAFPPAERRLPGQQRLRVDTEGRMHCCVIMHADATAGLLTWWDLGDVRYVEHFAVDPSLRGGGIGACAIKQLLAQSDKPLVLEVEHPTDEITTRRIGFYRRAGLRLWPDLGYVQPPYSPGAESVDMLLMATPDLAPDHFGHVNSLLRHHVYKVE